MDLYILQWSGFFYLVYWICIFYNDLVSCISGVLYLVYWICIFYNDLVYCIWFPVYGLLDLYMILLWSGFLYLVYWICIFYNELVYCIWFPASGWLNLYILQWSGFLYFWFIGSVYFTIIWLLESPAIFSNSL